MQLDPINLALKAPGTKRLKLKSDETLPSFAFKFNLRRYTMGDDSDVEILDGDSAAPAVISFLLQLTFQQPGQPYPTDGLPPAQRRVVSDLAHLGLLYLLARGS